MKKVMVQFNIPGVTQRQYDNVWNDLRAAGKDNPKGLIHHFGAPSENGWSVVEIWDSAESIEAFAPTLMPLLEKQGIPVEGPPPIQPLYYDYQPKVAAI